MISYSTMDEARTMQTTSNAVYKKEGDWYIAFVEELPGANSQGRTLEEARRNLKEAVELILVANREIAEREFTGE